MNKPSLKSKLFLNKRQRLKLSEIHKTIKTTEFHIGFHTPKVPLKIALSHIFVISGGTLMKKINRCLTDISQCLTNTENQFYKISVILVKYRFVSVILVKYRFTQISTLMIFSRYLTDTFQKLTLSVRSVKYRLNIGLLYFPSQ